LSSKDSFIYGKNPVEELLLTNPEQVEKVYLKKGARGKDFHLLFHFLPKTAFRLQTFRGKNFTIWWAGVNDQGVVAAVSRVSYLEFEEWLKSVKPDADTAILLLDEIEDPHNFGAILRTAAAAGITAVVVPKHRQAPVNAAVFKTSAGTAGRIPIVRAVNLNQAILSSERE
jgi:23S rRNA (guanosine2251-2'-O)-methyltransferase